MASSTNKESLPSQQFIAIESIDNDVIVLKGGALRKILLVSGINIALKSEEEQGIIIYAFQGFLNSLDFSIQILIHSRKLNIDQYLQKMGERGLVEENALLKNQISEYTEFVRAFVSQNAIMQKQFFVVVPFDPIKLPETGLGPIDKMFGFFKQQSNSSNLSTKEEQYGQLQQRVDQVISGLNQIGLRSVPLENNELLEVFYNLYNPATTEQKGMKLPETN